MNNLGLILRMRNLNLHSNIDFLKLIDAILKCEFDFFSITFEGSVSDFTVDDVLKLDGKSKSLFFLRGSDIGNRVLRSIDSA